MPDTPDERAKVKAGPLGGEPTTRALGDNQDPLPWGPQQRIGVKPVLCTLASWWRPNPRRGTTAPALCPWTSTPPHWSLRPARNSQHPMPG